MSDKIQNPERFKILRAIDPAIIGGTRPVEVAKDKVHFANANGGLRLVNPDEVRKLAFSSAKNLLSVLAANIPAKA
jgi:hypothetical protein